MDKLSTAKTYILLFTATTCSCFSHSPAAKKFKDQNKKEMQLIRPAGDVYNHKDTETKIPELVSISITMNDALSLAIKKNRTIKEQIATYKMALLSYQSELFQFQFSPGSLSYDYSYDYQDQGPTLSISNTAEQTWPNGFSYSLTNSAYNSPNDAPDSNMVNTSTLSVSQEIFGSTRLYNNNTLKSARESLALAKLTLKDSVVTMLTTVSTQFRNVLFGEESLEALKETLATGKKNTEAAKIQLDMGLISKSDYETIRLQEVNTAININTQKYEVREGLNKLKIYIGLTIDDHIKILPSLTSNKSIEKVLKKMLDHEPSQEKHYLHQALTGSQTLIYDKINIEAAHRELITSFRSKNISLGVTGELSYTANEAQAGDSSVGIQLTLPLDNKSTNNSIQSQKLSIVVAKEAFMDDCIDLIREESDSYETMVTNYKRSDLTSQQMHITKLIDEATQIKFKYGSVPATDVQTNHQSYLDAINNLRDAENTYANSVEDYHKITNHYLETLKLPLTPELDTILQIINLPGGEKSIATPQFDYPEKNIYTKSPTQICYELMKAPIKNM